MSLQLFQYGIGAVIFPEDRAEFDQVRDHIIRDTLPMNFAEQLLVDQMIHAEWELYRVEKNAIHIDSEETLTAVAARAHRNFARAQKALVRLQSARASHSLCHSPAGLPTPPTANLSKVPKRRGYCERKELTYSTRQEAA
jgi:hypothetical protein